MFHGVPDNYILGLKMSNYIFYGTFGLPSTICMAFTESFRPSFDRQHAYHLIISMEVGYQRTITYQLKLVHFSEVPTIRCIAVSMENRGKINIQLLLHHKNKALSADLEQSTESRLKS